MSGSRQFERSEDIYAAGYAVPLYDNIENKTRWRYRDQSFVTDGPPLLCEQISFRGVALSVQKVKELKHDGKRD
jgi:hypothetical protein